MISSNNEKPFRDSHQREKSMLISSFIIKYVPGVRSVEQQRD